MLDSEHSPRSYKTLKKSIGAIIKHLEMLRFAPDHLKTKKCVQMQLGSYRLY